MVQELKSSGKPVSIESHFCQLIECLCKAAWEITIPRRPRGCFPLRVLHQFPHRRKWGQHYRWFCELFLPVSSTFASYQLQSLWAVRTFSFQYLLSSVVNIDSLLAGFLAQTNAVERVPGFIIFVNNRWRKLDGCCLLVAEVQQEMAKWQMEYWLDYLTTPET